MFESARASLMMQVARLRTQSLLTQLKLEGDMASASETPVFANPGQRPAQWRECAPHFGPAKRAGLASVWHVLCGGSDCRSFVEERNCGALARLRSLGTTPATLLAAKVAPTCW